MVFVSVATEGKRIVHSDECKGRSKFLQSFSAGRWLGGYLFLAIEFFAPRGMGTRVVELILPWRRCCS